MEGYQVLLIFAVVLGPTELSASCNFTHSGNHVSCTYLNSTLDDHITFDVLENNAENYCDVIGDDDECRNKLIETGILITTKDYPCERVINNDTVWCQFNMTSIDKICCRLNQHANCHNITSPPAGFFTTLATSDEGSNGSVTTNDVTASTSNDVLTAVAVIVVVVLSIFIVVVLSIYSKRSAVVMGNSVPRTKSSVELQQVTTSLDESRVEDLTNKKPSSPSPVAQEVYTDRRSFPPHLIISRHFSEPTSNGSAHGQLSDIHPFPIELGSENDESKDRIRGDESRQLQDANSSSGNKDLQVPTQPQVEEQSKISVEETGGISDDNQPVHVFLPPPYQQAPVVIDMALPTITT